MLASPVVDRDLLRRKLAELAEYVSQVSEYRDLTVERYRAEWKTQRIVERTLQMAIETCLDIASHVLADRKLGAPSTYGETFVILMEAGLMSRGLGRVMVEMTGFRNVIVHEYARIDADTVVRILREHLEDFRRFEAEALAFHEKLRDGFLTLAANEPGRCVLIDATLPKEEVSEQIWRVVTKRLDPATAPIAFEEVAS